MPPSHRIRPYDDPPVSGTCRRPRGPSPALRRRASYRPPPIALRSLRGVPGLPPRIPSRGPRLVLTGPRLHTGGTGNRPPLAAERGPHLRSLAGPEPPGPCTAGPAGETVRWDQPAHRRP